MDRAIGADGSAIDRLREKVEAFRKAVTRPLTLGPLLGILAIGLGSTALVSHAATMLPEVGDIISEFTWVVLLVTGVGLGLSFTPARKLEGAGASTVGSAFLYLLVATIGAKAEFRALLDVPGLVAVGALWMGIHAVVMLGLRRVLKAPVFFLAVGSQANIGGAASAPVVAGAFHPALAPVGVLLGVAGYVLGTYAGLVCAFLLEQVYLVMG